MTAPHRPRPADALPRHDPLSDAEALALADADAPLIEELCRRAAARRDALFGRTLTYSPKVFLPVTNLCRNHCDYCSFRRSSGDAGEWTMSPAEVRATLEAGRRSGAGEALLCLGDRPETAFPAYRRTLAEYGHASTVDYLVQVSQLALDAGLLPHTNAGVLSREELRRLRPYNVSLGLMLENVSLRLCAPGMPHHKAPDKRPAKRLQMLEQAGELRIPFTSGILLGIGETRRERVESLLALRASHRRHGHLQEVIVQNFVPHSGTRPLTSQAVEALELRHAIALARLILDDEVSVQTPPNLNAERLEPLIEAGLNDFGGVSPVTPDYVNSQSPWPHLRTLQARCAGMGFQLRARPPLHPRWAAAPEWLDERLREPTAQVTARLQQRPPEGRPLQ